MLRIIFTPTKQQTKQCNDPDCTAYIFVTIPDETRRPPHANINLTVKDVKVFVPAKKFEESLRFYQALGWQINFKAEDNSIAELELVNCRFLLQNFYNKELAENFMLHISVEDVGAWYEHAATVIENGNHQNTRMTEPKKNLMGPWWPMFGIRPVC